MYPLTTVLYTACVFSAGTSNGETKASRGAAETGGTEESGERAAGGD